jgi:hypothetical protein
MSRDGNESVEKQIKKLTKLKEYDSIKAKRIGECRNGTTTI